MQRVMIVYESMFGNTELVARSIAQGMLDGARGEGCEAVEVELREVGSAPPEIGDELDLLVVGAPTHAFGLSRPASRTEAAGMTSAPVMSNGDGIREWLAGVDIDTSRLRATVFDTHTEPRKMLRHIGSAGTAIARRLTRLGIHQLDEPEHYSVRSVLGPLTAGELDRAYAWGHALVAKVPVA